MQAVKPYFKVLYNGKNITENVSRYLIDIAYTDKVSGESDELNITLDDKDGYWQNEWYPSKGATLTVELGYDNGKVIKPEVFQIDEIELSWSGSDGDIVTIKALGTGINKKVRTKRSSAHENKTLSEIINSIAARNGYKVVGNIEKITIGRVTQHREKDITFLHRLAAEYGYAFTIKGNKLVFYSSTSLEASKHILTIDKTDTSSGSIKDKSSETYSSASVKSHNPNKNKTIKSVYHSDDIKTGEVLEIRSKTETEQQANAKAKAALHRANSLQQTASISVPGNVSLLAGINIELTGFGANSGIWHILTSDHRIDKNSGYSTSAELKRVIPATVSGSKKKPKVQDKKTTTPTKDYLIREKSAPFKMDLNYFNREVLGRE